MVDLSHSKGHRQRLRERIMQGGRDALHDYELLEYVLGLAIPRRDTKPLAKSLIQKFGSFASVISAEPQTLKAEELSDNVVATLKFIQAAALELKRAAIIKQPILSSWQALLDYLHADMAHAMNEKMRVVYLNSNNLIVADEVMSEGTVNHTSVYIREIMKRAMELGATAIILVHNHPSGDSSPSQDDIAVTKKIITAGSYLDVRVHDHVIIGKKGYTSLKSEGMI